MTPLEYLTAMHDSLFGAHSRPATQGRTHNERIAPSQQTQRVEPSVQEGVAGASATPNLRSVK